MPTVLVVDDQPRVVQTVTTALSNWGDYELLTAYDGQSALDLARQRHPDLVILDVMMPGMDGFQVLKALKSDPETEDIAVLMLTAKDQPLDIVDGLDAGADYYVPKPFHPRDLASLVKRHFEE